MQGKELIGIPNANLATHIVLLSTKKNDSHKPWKHSLP